MWLIALAACADPDGTADPARFGLLVGEPVRIEPADGSQNHATIALLDDGSPLLALHDAGELRVLTLDGAVDLHLDAPAPSYPQATAYDGGAVVFTVANAVVLRPVDGESVSWPVEQTPYWADVAELDDGALLAWTELDWLNLSRVGGDPVELPLRTGSRSGPMTLRTAPDGARLAWSELADGFMDVFVGLVSPDGAILGDPVVVDRVEDSLGGRPGLAVRDDGTFAVTWRGWPDTLDARAWMAVYDVDGERLVGPVQLGGIANRPVVEVTDEGWLAAWAETTAEGTRIVLQRFDPTLAPLGPVLPVSAGPTDDRPYLVLRDGVGALSWEGAGDVWVSEVGLRRDR